STIEATLRPTLKAATLRRNGSQKTPTGFEPSATNSPPTSAIPLTNRYAATSPNGSTTSGCATSTTTSSGPNHPLRTPTPCPLKTGASDAGPPTCSTASVAAKNCSAIRLARGSPPAVSPSTTSTKAATAGQNPTTTRSVSNVSPARAPARPIPTSRGTPNSPDPLSTSERPHR